MATTTPNYGWDVPTSTDYVKDGATAIETLGDDIDASLFSITGGKNVGLSHITSGTFTTQGTVNINSCFTSGFRNYKILWNVTSYSASPTLNFRLRAAGADIGTAGTDYTYGSQYFTASTVNGARSTAASTIELQQSIGGASASFALDVFNPQATEITRIAGVGFMPSGVTQLCGGSYQLTTSADGFTMYLNTGTMTGNYKIYAYKD